MPPPFAVGVPTATVLLPGTECPECKYQYSEEMSGKACTGRVPTRDAKGDMKFDNKGIPIMQPCPHVFAAKDEPKLRSRIDMLSPELKGMLVKGKPRSCAQVENDFWKGVGKVSMLSLWIQMWLGGF
jgi:hypothetical protein